MASPKHRPPARRPAAGFTLMEVIVAMVLIAACLLPAAAALRDTIRAPGEMSAAARNLDCVSSLMETVLAEPYARLLSLASASGPSAYPVPVDGCPPRTVTIARYGVDSTQKIGPGGTSNNLLYVSVGLANAADGNPFTLTTLVAQ
jgi:prepilin-type N-terminal cleavage/methylation domain-containing protein